jgi:hypothetical protein
VWVHPEVSFAVASGTSLGHSKRTWAGIEERRVILADHGLTTQGPMLPGGANAGPMTYSTPPSRSGAPAALSPESARASPRIPTSSARADAPSPSGLEDDCRHRGYPMGARSV